MIIPMVRDYTVQISTWAYENEYSLYSFQKNNATVSELMNGDYYVFIDQRKYLSGYFCFGKSAQILTSEKDVYDSQVLDIIFSCESIS